MDYYYDVALSFAGEDRAYVEECANILSALGIRVFYDSYELSELWGKDLYTYLADIYSNKSMYVMVFVSKHYVEKRWTKQEFKFINERIFKSDTEYLLPIFLDDTSLLGIPLTQGYLCNKTPYEVAVTFAKRFNNNIDVELKIQELEEELLGYKLSIAGDKVRFINEEEEVDNQYPLSFLMELYKHNLLFELFVAPAIIPN